MDRKARDRKLWKRSFDYMEGAVWLAFKARGFVVGVKKGRKGVGRKEQEKYQLCRNIFNGTWLGLLSIFWCLASTPLRCFVQRVFGGLVRTLCGCLGYGRISRAFPIYSSGALLRYYFGA